MYVSMVTSYLHAYAYLLRTYIHMLTSDLHTYAHLLRTCVRLPLTYLHTSMLASYLQSYICLPSYLHAYAHESLTYTRGVAMLERGREGGSERE